MANIIVIPALPSGSGGSGTPGGTNGQIQYNNAGAFGGDTSTTDGSGNITATSETLTSLTASKAVATDGSKKLISSTTSAAELNFVAGVTSAIQTQLNAKQGTITIGALDAQAANATGQALVANVLSAQSADATHPGLINTATQNLAGSKSLTQLAVGTTTFNSGVAASISGQSTIVAPPSNTMLQVTGIDGNSARLAIDTFNNVNANGSSVQMRRARGTAGTPLAVALDDTMAQFAGIGYGATAFGAASVSSIALKAAQAYTDTAMGSYIQFSTTPLNSVTSAVALKINSDKTLTASGYSTGALSSDSSGNIASGTLALSNGGTGGTSASTARSSLGLNADLNNVENAAVTIASASSVAIGAAASDNIIISGVVTITSFDTVASGIRRTVRFSGALTLTHNATSLILPGSANISTTAGDCAEFLSEGSGNWRCVNFMPIGAYPINMGGTGGITAAAARSSLGFNADAQNIENAAVTIASASSVAIGAAASDNIIVSGAVTITSFDTVADGVRRWVKFTGSLTLTHNATSLILPGSANITTANGDVALFESLGSGNWKCYHYQPVAALPVNMGGTGLTTIASTRVPYATGTDTIGTSANLTFNGSNFVVGGSMSISNGNIDLQTTTTISTATAARDINLTAGGNLLLRADNTGAGAKTLTLNSATNSVVNIFNGAQRWTIRSISANTTLDTTTTDMLVYASSAGGAISVTLPAHVAGRVLLIKDSGFSALTNNITLVRSGGTGKIENASASYVMNLNGQSVMLGDNGTDWFILSNA